MSVPQRVSDCIAGILKDAARRGKTTKNDVVLDAMNKMRPKGTNYGLPPAMLHIAVQQIYARETDRQMKLGLPPNVYSIAMRNAPPELVKLLPKLAAWIAISEGTKALWVPSLRASADDWMANAALKEKKAQQTIDRATESEDVARYLLQYDFTCLEDSFVEAA